MTLSLAFWLCRINDASASWVKVIGRNLTVLSPSFTPLTAIAGAVASITFSAETLVGDVVALSATDCAHATLITDTSRSRSSQAVDSNRQLSVLHHVTEYEVGSGNTTQLELSVCYATAGSVISSGLTDSDFAMLPHGKITMRLPPQIMNQRVAEGSVKVLTLHNRSASDQYVWTAAADCAGPFSYPMSATSTQTDVFNSVAGSEGALDASV